MPKLLIVGEINVDLILQGYQTFPMPGKEVLVDDFVMTLGSASAICAKGLARLGMPVAFLGKVGQDPWGEFCLDTMSAAGIDISRVERDSDIKTGVTVSISSATDRALVSFLGSIRALTGADVPDAAFEGFTHLHTSSYFLQQGLRPHCKDVLRRAKRRGLTTSLDPGFDPSETWGRDLVETLAEVDLFFPNEVESFALTGERDPVAGLRALRNGRTRTVVKLGASGAMTLEGDEVLHVPAFPIQAVDTTGAGDSFDAGYLDAFLRGAPPVECLRRGAACGALSTRGSGGTATQATGEEADAFLRSHA
jgi:sugar/nucleoside kinase (ribokinase family)